MRGRLFLRHVIERDSESVALLVRSPTAHKLKNREPRGWNTAMASERLMLVVQNRRYLLLVERGNGEDSSRKQSQRTRQPPVNPAHPAILSQRFIFFLNRQQHLPIILTSWIHNESNSNAERTLQSTTTDMSFTINTNLATTCNAIGAQGKNAQERRVPQHTFKPTRNYGEFEDSTEMLMSLQTSTAIRRAQNFQATLSDSYSFLQTQDIALEQLQKLIHHESEILDGQDPSADPEFLQVFQSLADEKFNNLPLFSHGTDEDPIYLESTESEASVRINRPRLVASPSDIPSLTQHIALARTENQRERKNILQLAEAPIESLDIPTWHTGKIPNADTAKETAAEYKKRVLLNAQDAISVQANANRESVLRLFN